MNVQRGVSALGAEVRRRRLEQGLTQMQVVARGGVGHGLVSALESGRAAVIQSHQVPLLAKGLGISEEEVVALLPPGQGGRYLRVL